MAEVKEGTHEEVFDIFDSIVCAEERFEQNGFLNGLQEGKEKGKKSGLQKGLNLGKQIGEEIGFYQGFVLTWKIILENSEEKNTKKLKALKSLLTMLHSLKVSDPTVSDYMQKLSQIRAKFKPVSYTHLDVYKRQVVPLLFSVLIG
ncbi:protein LTO1 homolog [Anneissia japonica]|uniref:protein LTO1 homolog n=1 Tax=Anneissia japonica TaxID=1529436 RepID=UPI0014258CDB|nr:protein LTO1 homolog [Anneissia japonica]